MFLITFIMVTVYMVCMFQALSIGLEGKFIATITVFQSLTRIKYVQIMLYVILYTLMLKCNTDSVYASESIRCVLIKICLECGLKICYIL